MELNTCPFSISSALGSEFVHCVCLHVTPKNYVEHQPVEAVTAAPRADL